MKVLLVTNEYPFGDPPQFGGGGSHVFYLAQSLTELGVSVLILAYSGAKKSDSPFEDNPEVNIVPCDFGPDEDFFPEEALNKAHEICRQYRPDVIHGHHLKGGLVGLAAAAAYNRPLVLTMHNPPKLVIEEHSASPPLYQRRRFYTLWRLISGHERTQAHVAYSKIHLKDLQENQAPPDKIEFIYHGVPVEFLQRKARLKRSRPFGVDPQDVVILCPLRPEKPGVETFIKAAAELLRSGVGRRHRLRFIVTGDPESPATMAHSSFASSLSPELPELMIFRSFMLRQMWDLFHRAQICVIPSWREGLGIAILEAMALGVPVVASEVSGINEVVEDGISGLLFQPGHHKELAEAIERLLSDHGLASRLAGNARERVAQEFSAKQMAMKHLSLYQKVAPEAPFVDNRITQN